MKVTELVESFAKPIVEANGCKLWDVEYVREGSERFLRIYIDKEGGADINDCEAVSRAVDPLLDEADPVQDFYYLQVFTPGVERKLTKEAHFEAYAEKSVLLRSIRPVNGERDFVGILKGFDGQNVSVLVGEELLAFPLKGLSYVKADDFNEGLLDG